MCSGIIFYYWKDIKMALDFQQIRQQIIELGSKAPERQKELSKMRDTARKLLTQLAMDQDYIQDLSGLSDRL